MQELEVSQVQINKIYVSFERGTYSTEMHDSNGVQTVSDESSNIKNDANLIYDWRH